MLSQHTSTKCTPRSCNKDVIGYAWLLFIGFLYSLVYTGSISWIRGTVRITALGQDANLQLSLAMYEKNGRIYNPQENMLRGEGGVGWMDGHLPV